MAACYAPGVSVNKGAISTCSANFCLQGQHSLLIANIFFANLLIYAIASWAKKDVFWFFPVEQWSPEALLVLLLLNFFLFCGACILSIVHKHLFCALSATLAATFIYFALQA